MRKHLRAVARANMKRAGCHHINKPRRTLNGGHVPSYFAENWGKYLKTPSSIERKAAKIRAENEHRRELRNAARI